MTQLACPAQLIVQIAQCKTILLFAQVVLVVMDLTAQDAANATAVA